MKRIDVKYFILMLLVTTTALSLVGCKKEEGQPYNSKNKLWFLDADPNDQTKILNNVVRSFSHYPGETELKVGFPINLIGSIPSEDISYTIAVVDSLTTAVEAEYEVVSPVFRAGNIVDTLWVKLFKTPRLDTKEVALSLYIVEDDNFGQGFYNRLAAKIKFNNITTKPVWWDAEMELSYFGAYSPKKFEEFVRFSGRFEIEGLAPSQLRRLLLDFKKYIKDNNITEENGDPMTLPII